MFGFALKESTTDTPSHRPGFTIEPLPSRANAFRLEMTGFLSPGWSGRLAASLAEHRIEIVRGQAERVSASSWRSVFELKSAPFAKNPVGLDFLHLASVEPSAGRKAPAISLSSVNVEPTGRHEGSLFIEVKGKDRLGFLADLLDYFSMRCLFPVKMTIDTEIDTAVDRFWLRGVGGSIPSEAISSSIRDSLELMLAARN